MRRKLAVLALLVVFLIGGSIVTYLLLPKKYLVGERLSQATVFWNHHEAFVFLNVMTLGRAQNVVQERIASSRYWYLLALTGSDFIRHRTAAFHLLASGKLDQPPLPQNGAGFGNWTLVDGKLQLTSFANSYRNSSGFRWNGEKFEPVPPQRPPSSSAFTITTSLTEDDPSENNEAADSGIYDKSQRKVFKEAGWHSKVLNGYEGSGAEATLPIILGNSTFNLVVHSANWERKPASGFDFLAGGARKLELSGVSSEGETTLWQQDGWKQISKRDYEQQIQESGRSTHLPFSIWISLLLIMFLMVWKLWSWGHLIFSFSTVKGRVLKNVPTTYSFPAALPAQFPLLDTAALERYTRQFENMGFERVLDTSPISDAANAPAAFCRVMVHPGHHIFGEVSQLFLRGKAPMAMRCSMKSHLEDGWSIGFSDRKPQPAGHLIRRPKALGVSMPDSQPEELLQSLLTLRQQICLDLGLSPLTDDTLESYVTKAQQAASEMRLAVKRTNFFTGLPKFYYRKLSLRKTKPEYVWLGDYPRLAEQRKQQYGLATT